MLRNKTTQSLAAQAELPFTEPHETTLTLIERKSRRVIGLHIVPDPAIARALFRLFGNGYDAQIRTPKYTELILSW